ncbi:MAG: glycosyltransferase [Vulcanimicrobiaceae bacterium]
MTSCSVPSAGRARARSDAVSVMHVVGSLRGGGAERCVRELVPRLNARGIATEIATIYPPRLTTVELAELRCNVYFRNKRPGFDPLHCVWLARTIARRGPTIVHTHMQAGKYVGRLAAMLARVPILIHTEHSPNPLVPGESVYGRLFWRRTAAVVTFGPSSVAIVRERERVRHFEVIPNGVCISPIPTNAQRRTARRRLEIDEETVVFAIVASLQERKNHRLAFEAFAAIRDDVGPRVRLALFGDGPLREDLGRLARALGIANLVRFYGFEPDVVARLPGVDVLVSVSRLEMAPISILEAMAAGLPVIATPHAGTDEMVVDGATGLVVAWNVASVADALRTARSDPAWRASCGAAGRARVERYYDIEIIADRHAALYRQMIAGAALRERHA